MSAPSRKGPGGPPASVGVLAKYTRAYARSRGVAEGRVRGWVAHMALAGVLERSASIPTHGGMQRFRFTIKGGVALELRLRERARATKDIDLVLHDARAELLDAVAFQATLGIPGPVHVPCLSLRFHMAQKLHGLTLPPRPGKRNERFKDLIDLMLMETLVSDYTGLREACEQVFESRATHAWPPVLELPEHWRDGYTKLAGDLELPVTDAADAMARVRARVARIEASCSIT